MYAETITMPHPRRQEVEQPRPLNQAAEIEAIRENLAQLALGPPESLASAKLAAASHITGMVHRSLWFPSNRDYQERKLSYPLTLDSIAENQMANCFGYTIVNSECMEQAGIDHYVAYTNGHGHTIVPTERDDQTELHMFDALSPKFNGEISDAIYRSESKTITDEINAHGRAAVLLDARLLTRNIGSDLHSLVQQHPWLKFAKNNRRIDNVNSYLDLTTELEPSRRRSSYVLVMSLFEASQGRNALSNYVAFQSALHSRQPYEAFQSLQNMKGAFPELDARQAHSEIKNLVKMLCLVDQPELAETAVDGYFSSFRLSRDSRIPMVMGDCLRLVANHEHAPESAGKRAREAYASALERPHAWRQVIEQKLAKLAVANGAATL